MPFDASVLEAIPEVEPTLEDVVKAAQVHADSVLAKAIDKEEKLKRRIAPTSVDPSPPGPGFEAPPAPPAKKIKVSSLTKSALIIKIKNIIIDHYVTESCTECVILDLMELCDEIELS